MTDQDDGAYRVDMPIWEAVPFTQQRYQHLLEVEAGLVWWDDKWKCRRKTGTPRGSAKMTPSADFIETMGLAYRSQKTNFSGWTQYALTTDGQILLARWKKGQR